MANQEHLAILAKGAQAWNAWRNSGMIPGSEQPDLEGADLSGAYLAGADLTEVNLRKANLQRANVNHASLDGALMLDADLSNSRCQFAEMPGAFLDTAI